MIYQEAYDLLKDFKKKGLTYSEVISELEENDIAPRYYISSIAGNKIGVKAIDDSKHEDFFLRRELNSIIRQYPYFQIDGVLVDDNYKLVDVWVSDFAKEGNKLKKSHNTMLMVVEKGLKVNLNPRTDGFESLEFDMNVFGESICNLQPEELSDSLPKKVDNSRYSASSNVTVLGNKPIRLSQLSQTYNENSIILKQKSYSRVAASYFNNQLDTFYFIVDDKIEVFSPSAITFKTSTYNNANIKFIIESIQPQVYKTLLGLTNKKRIKKLNGSSFTRVSISIVYDSTETQARVLNQMENDKNSLIAMFRQSDKELEDCYKLESLHEKDVAYTLINALDKLGEKYIKQSKVMHPSGYDTKNIMNSIKYKLTSKYSVTGMLWNYMEAKAYKENNLKLVDCNSFMEGLDLPLKYSVYCIYRGYGGEIEHPELFEKYETVYQQLDEAVDYLDEYFNHMYDKLKDRLNIKVDNKEKSISMGTGIIGRLIDDFFEFMEDFYRYMVSVNNNPKDYEKEEDVMTKFYEEFVTESFEFQPLIFKYIQEYEVFIDINALLPTLNLENFGTVEHHINYADDLLYEYIIYCLDNNLYPFVSYYYDKLTDEQKVFSRREYGVVAYVLMKLHPCYSYGETHYLLNKLYEKRYQFEDEDVDLEDDLESDDFIEASMLEKLAYIDDPVDYFSLIKKGVLELSDEEMNVLIIAIDKTFKSYLNEENYTILRQGKQLPHSYGTNITQNLPVTNVIVGKKKRRVDLWLDDIFKEYMKTHKKILPDNLLGIFVPKLKEESFLLTFINNVLDNDRFRDKVIFVLRYLLKEIKSEEEIYLD